MTTYLLKRQVKRFVLKIWYKIVPPQKIWTCHKCMPQEEYRENSQVQLLHLQIHNAKDQENVYHMQLDVLWKQKYAAEEAERKEKQQKLTSYDVK